MVVHGNLQQNPACQKVVQYGHGNADLKLLPCISKSTKNFLPFGAFPVADKVESAEIRESFT